MREQSHRDSRRGTPSWHRSYERDPGIRENGRISPSYLSPTEPDRSRQVPVREVPTSGGDVRSFCAWESRNPESGEYRQNRYFAGLNRINDPVHPDRSLFGMMGSVPKGDYSGEGRELSMSRFSDSVLGIGGKSTSRKFQWDKLLGDDKPVSANASRNNYGGLCDSGVVPVSMSVESNGRGSSIACYNQRMKESESGRNYGFMDGGYAPASPNPCGKVGVRGRNSSFVDPIVDKIGDKDIGMLIDSGKAFRNNMMNERMRMLLENDTSFAENEKDVNCRSLNAPASPNPCGKVGVRGRNSSFVDSIVDKIGDKDIGMLLDNGKAFRNNMMNERMRMLLENGTSFAENEKDVNCRSSNVNPGNRKFEEDFSFPRNDHGCSVYEDDVERIPILYEEFDHFGNSCQQVVPLEEALEMRLERNRIDNQKLLEKVVELGLERKHIENQKILLSYGNAFEDASDITSGGDGNWTSEEIEQLVMLEDPGLALYQGRSTGSAIDAMAIDRNSYSSADVLSMSRHSSKPSKLSKRNVRQRLGPVLSVKQRLEFPAQVGKRQIASRNKKKHPWLKHVTENTWEDLEQKISVPEVKFPDTKAKEYAKTEQKEYAKTEPREDSEEFKNQVHKAFLKFFKILNENSADLRKYLEQGGAGRSKCCICGSYSKEFVDTLGLAQHAFFSYKSRLEHLGLYKAICVLMGWNSTIVEKGRWIQQILPSVEASSLREDLIIWPPVILIHNSSLANDNKDIHMTVSIEGLKQILRGMGCNLRMTNICHGKAANRSSMVVIFSGTYTGLGEAEKIHKLFSEKQRGRVEFQQISSSGHKTALVDDKTNHQETRNILVDDKTNHQDTRSVPADDKMNHRETQNIPVDDKTNHQETQNVPVDDKMNHQETQNVPVNDKMNHQETPKVLVDNIESFLYGYMGIASDLDELDSETKRRSVVKSKKEIEAIAGASLKTQ